MAKGNIDTDDAGKLNQDEKAILDYLYANPIRGIGTGSLMRAFRPDQDTEGKQQQAYREIQGAIETLVLGGLVKGKRGSRSGEVYFDDLRLTPKGERAAIKERKGEKAASNLDVHAVLDVASMIRGDKG